MTARFKAEDELDAQIDVKLWQKIVSRALHRKRYFYPLLFLGALMALGELSITLVTRSVIDAVVMHPRSANEFTVYIYGYVGLTCAFFIGARSFIYLGGALSNHLAYDVRRDGFDRLQELEFAFYDTRPVGWLITRLIGDCNKLAYVTAWSFYEMVWGSSFIILITISLLLMNWGLALIVIAVVPALVVTSRMFHRRILVDARKARKYSSQVTAAFDEAIQGVRTTKTLVREAESLKEFQVLSEEMLSASMCTVRRNAAYRPVVIALGSLATGIALWRGGLLTAIGGMSPGTLVAFVSLVGQFFVPINQLAQRFTDLQAAQAAGERIMELVETKPTIRDSENVLRKMSETVADAQTPDGGPREISSIEFRNVAFAYGHGPIIIHNLNLTIKKGETIALVGSSGGGKSTIVSIVCRFREPTSGSVLVNGTDYRERSLGWFQAQLGVVLQTPHLFKGTIRQNIRYGRLDATDAEIEAAARLVYAHGFIATLEQGYESQVGEGGNRLSVGQRQLISLTRALLADPQIFIMDEVTSSIDTETEQLIQRGLQMMLAGRICFVIAHRLSTIKRASRIAVITNGRIEEIGTHQELLSQRGHYFNLHMSHFKSKREAAILGI